MRERELSALPAMAGDELIHALVASGGVPTALTPQAEAALLRALAVVNHFNVKDLPCAGYLLHPQEKPLGRPGIRVVEPVHYGTTMSLPTLPPPDAAENTDNEHIPPVLAVGTADSRESGVCCPMPWCGRDGLKCST